MSQQWQGEFGYGFHINPWVYWTDNGTDGDSARAWEKDRIYSIVTEFAKTGANETAMRMTVDGMPMMHDQRADARDAMTNALVNAGCSLAIFGCNVSGKIGYFARARIYGLKIWRDGKLVRHFVPVQLDVALPALWDKIGEKVYESSGAKALTAFGPVIGDYVKPPKSTVILVR